MNENQKSNPRAAASPDLRPPWWPCSASLELLDGPDWWAAWGCSRDAARSTQGHLSEDSRVGSPPQCGRASMQDPQAPPPPAKAWLMLSPCKTVSSVGTGLVPFTAPLEPHSIRNKKGKGSMCLLTTTLLGLSPLKLKSERVSEQTGERKSTGRIL